MSIRLTEAEARRLGLLPDPKPSKYRSRFVVVDGIKFRSQKEAAHYRGLCFGREAGTVKWFLRQVPFHLPGGVKYLADFVVVRPLSWDGVETDPTACVVQVVDVKGYRTAAYKRNKKMVEALYGIEIIEA